MSIQNGDLSKELTVTVGGCEPDEKSNETKTTWKLLEDNAVLITIFETKPQGRVYEYKAKMPLDTLSEVLGSLLSVARRYPD